MFNQLSCKQRLIQQCVFSGLLTLTFLLSLRTISASSNTYTEKDNTFTGTVTPILDANVRYGFNDTDRGIVIYATRPGELVCSEIKELNGNIVKEADLLIKLKSDYHKQEVDNAKAALASAKSNLLYEYKEYKRAIKLGKNSNVISKQLYETTIAKYKQANSDFITAQQTLIEAESLYKLSNLRTPFDAIIRKVNMAGGLLNNEPQILLMSSVNPMGIEIKLDHTIAKKFNINSKVTVYPVRGKEKTTGILHKMNRLTDDGIILAVNNYLAEPDDNKENLPIINSSFPVIRFNFIYKPVKPLAVPIASIRKDDKGYFVWKLDGPKNVEPGKGLASIYTTRKVYIKPGNLIRQINTHFNYRLLDDSANLTQYDMVIVADNIAEKLVDGGKAYYRTKKYIFMPGDKVKVIVND